MDLVASRLYQPDIEESAEIDYIVMPVSELPVSAGLGAFLEGEMFQQIQVPASSVPAGAEFGIYVSGDSMEPRYHSGHGTCWVSPFDISPQDKRERLAYTRTFAKEVFNDASCHL